MSKDQLMSMVKDMLNLVVSISVKSEDEIKTEASSIKTIATHLYEQFQTACSETKLPNER